MGRAMGGCLGGGQGGAGRGLWAGGWGGVGGDLGGMFEEGEEVFAAAAGGRYGEGWSRDRLVAFARAAHGKGMAVVVLPPARFRGENPYPRALAEVAADAQAARV